MGHAVSHLHVAGSLGLQRSHCITATWYEGGTCSLLNKSCLMNAGLQLLMGARVWKR